MKKTQVHLKSFAFKKKNRLFQFLLSGANTISADWCRLRLTGLFMAIALVFPGSMNKLHAQDAQINRIWKTVSESQLTRSGERHTIPSKFRSLQINNSEMRTLLAKAPTEPANTARLSNGLVFHMPMPDGTFQRFSVFEYSVMHPDLAAKYPEIKSYTGQGIDDPSAGLKLSITPFGFHAMVLSPHGTIYIDPYCKNNITDYICYNKKDLQHTSSFSCGTTGDDTHLKELIGNNSGSSGNRSSGTELRTYRLALACTGEYADYFGGNINSIIAAENAVLNRINAIFETEVAIRFELAANNDFLIFTNSNADPYTNNDKDTMQSQNQLVCDNIIGSANYDIGHLLCTTFGGRGEFESVCNDGLKARGFSGHPDPNGIPFIEDLLAHELGHQFGGHHTFNSSYSNPPLGCIGPRDNDHAFEPGSGVTIMSYAGLCDYDNILGKKIPYFHAASLRSIINYTTLHAGDECPVITGTGNTSPFVTSMGNDSYIPISTPFVLTGAATDADGHPLTYSWEEYDLGDPCPWFFQSTDAPIFRNYEPATSPSRTFPELTAIVKNTLPIGELLPIQPRTLKFKLTVRDNRMGGGGIMVTDNTLNIEVVDNGGPFKVTAPVSNAVWVMGTTTTVIWNVGGTNNAPISTANVKISLSTDSGYTFPYVLLANTPNDGSQSITVPIGPNFITPYARIKVEAIGNIFFNMNNGPFIIAPSPVLSAITTSIAATNYCAGEALNVSYTTNTQTPADPGNVFTVQLSNSTGSFAAIPTTIGALQTPLTIGTGIISCTIPAGIATGNGYRIRVKSSSPQVNGSDNGTDVSISGYIPAAGSISGSNTVCKGASATFSITPLSNVTSYSWAVPSSATIISGNGTNTIQVMFGQSALSGKIVVYGSNANCNSESSELFITLNSSPTSTINGNTSICSGSSTTLSANVVPTGNYTYQWSKNGAIILGATSQNYNATIAATYTLTVTNASGCTGTATKILSASNVTASIPSGNSTYCGSPATFTFSANTGTNFSYQWYRNGSTAPGNSNLSTYTTSLAGSYTVRVTQGGVCSATSTAATATIGSIPPAPTITPSTPQTICTGDSVMLTSSTLTGAIYYWQRNSATINYSQNSIYAAKTTGTYRVNRAVQGCGAFSQTLSVTVTSCRQAGEGNDEQETSAILIIPNPFSESATVTLPADMDLKNASLDIYNVLGEKIKTIFVDQPQVSLTTEKLQPGVYLLRLNAEKSTGFVTKFVIQ